MILFPYPSSIVIMRDYCTHLLYIYSIYSISSLISDTILFLSQVACGLNHSLCVSVDGSMVWAFGNGDYGKLGLGNSTAKATPFKVDGVCGLTGGGVSKVQCGTQFSVAITRDGKIYSWGQGKSVIFLFLPCLGAIKWNMLSALHNNNGLLRIF